MSARRVFIKNSPQAINACGDVAQQERFELSSRVSGYTISSRARYDHFDTTAYLNAQQQASLYQNWA